MNTVDLLGHRIAELIACGEFAVGDHLPAQMLADRLRVSRWPISSALKKLQETGVLARRPNRGYFVARTISSEEVQQLLNTAPQARATTASIYFRIAEDLLDGLLPAVCTETDLRNRYGVSKGQLTAVLERIVSEGWVERRPGYGWEFSSMMTTPETLLQSYRLRLALEPAALLEPHYRLEPRILRRCRDAELHLLNGGIEHDSADQLHERGVRFHESLVEASGNPFFIDTIRRVNRVRRLLSYRSMRDRSRYQQQCKQHLDILALLEQERNEEASAMLRAHLQSTLDNLTKIQSVLATNSTEELL